MHERITIAFLCDTFDFYYFNEFNNIKFNSKKALNFESVYYCGLTYYGC